MISKSSRSGVGSLIRGRALLEPQNSKRRPALFYALSLKTPQDRHQVFDIVPTGNKIDAPVFTLFPAKEKEDSFALLFQEYYSSLCYFAQSIIHNEEEAKDIVQDCFVKLWDQATFMEQADTAPSFLYTAVRNKCFDLLRKRKVIDKAKQYSLLHTDDAFTYFDETAFAEMMRLILKHVDELPATMQEVIKLHYLEGKKYKEIASQLHSTPDAVRMQKERALKMIRKKLLSILLFIKPF